MTRLIRLPLALLLAGTLITAPGLALAHDELVGSDPGSGASGPAPEELTLTYSGQIAQVGAQVQVLDEDGEGIVEGEPVVEGTTLVQDLTQEMTDGEYAVVWRVTSRDGHPISGEFNFTVVGSVDTAGEDGVPDPGEVASVSGDTDETEGATQAAAAEEAGGLPFWAVAFIAAALLGLVAVFAMTWSRKRP